ncbi:hypothetical protein [Methylobacterium soli]|uniref:Uncharacterized protein n=1 Tax=Methylobacterium soli TaxID=553447 RepID=A0A6L3SSL5_9HYPH|nr:hypothetical protein [Methylobacterium soli]KAB1075420.1 hypothetical protein F6X53_24970 [Methylobacterium soli]GJE41315.1 hypothetical protein AEGHOMDF_0479 [Methylobacterium soli]
MEVKQQELEARIVAIEHTLQVIVNCLSDRQSLDRGKLVNLLGAAADEAKGNASNAGIPAALRRLAEQL